MLIYLIFDVEDLVHSDSDDIPRDIGTMLADDGVVATMCVVGEKARLWEQRGRRDVLAAVAQHDVCLHTDRHSVHPTVSEYLADKDWADGVAEIVRQEGQGARDLARILGQYPSSWGTSGNSWGPQVPAGTRLVGIPSNVYTHVKAGDTGACWFAGQLCYSDYVGLPGGEDAYCDDEAFERGLPALLAEIERARQNGVGCIGLFGGHPTRLRYRVFWDALNYNRGQNTTPTDYQFAPRREDDAYRLGLRNLRRMVAAVRELPEVRILSVRALNQRVPPDHTAISWDELGKLASDASQSAVISTDDSTASPAQLLDLLGRAFLTAAIGSTRPKCLLPRLVLGPVSQPPLLDQSLVVNATQLLSMCEALVRHIDATQHLPVSLEVDGVQIGPGPFLRSLTRAYPHVLEGTLTPTSIEPGPQEPDVAESLAQEGIYKMLPEWTPHTPDLKLEKLALHMRLQCWSLKPALLI
ncbi:MAG: hypothetical protein GX620_03270 [Chloroflexi bacterium]|nr:hypothetical protein [Chloroflexota bacterium]